MKKQRQIFRQQPIQLSANKKSHSINLKKKQEPLFAPFKIDWKNPPNDNLLFSANQSLPIKQPFKNIENSANSSPFGSNINSNTNSKLFYKNMKNQLMNIKQDVEKLILKEKKTSVTSVQQILTAKDEHPLNDYQNNDGCIKTISIKNKCQQKASKVEYTSENVDKLLANKIFDNCSVSSKFTMNESRNEHPVMKNLIQNSIKNVSNIDQNYRSQKDASCMRSKSKSIAETFSKGFVHDLFNARQQTIQNNKIRIASSQKFIQNGGFQNHQEQLVEKSEKSKPKMEVQIKLPSFEKTRRDQLQIQQENFNEQNNNLIEKLQFELNHLEKELSSRDQLISHKQESKFKLNEEIQKIKKQFQAEKQSNQEKSIKFEEEMTNLRQLNQENLNRAGFYEQELQKAVYVIRQKEQQVFNLMETSKNQTNAIQELNKACEKLTCQIRQMKQSVDQTQNIKEKMKLKENQLYIYQEELKQAKSKIKQLKESLADFIPIKLSDNLSKTVEAQQKTLEQSSKLKWELKQLYRLNESFKAQNQRLQKEFHSLNGMNSQNQSKIAQLIKQNLQLTTKINKFEKDSQSAIQDLINSADFQGIGNQISKKLSQMVDENYELKNKISRLESSLQQTTLLNTSIKEQLQIYREKSDSLKDCTRRLKIEDWDDLTAERDLLKSEVEIMKDRLEQTREFYELETMRKQNEIYDLKQKIEDMIQIEQDNEQSYHPNVRSVKHIKKLDVLLSEFKEMIEQNLELKAEIESLRI